jgi:hypothetical protein
MNESWTWIMQIALMLVTIGGGGGVVYWLVGLIKEKLGTDGWWTVALVGVLSFLMAVAGLVVDGQLSPDSLQPDNVALLVGLVFYSSQFWYRQLK